MIYGGVGHADYILETMGCGAAFIDYDNDGWLDIVVLTGRRCSVDAGQAPPFASITTIATARLPTSPQKSGLGRSVWAAGITVGDYDNDGFDDIFITCWGQNILFHNNGNGTLPMSPQKPACCIRARAMAPAAPGSITIATASSICSSRITWSSIPTRSPPRGKDPGCN